MPETKSAKERKLPRKPEPEWLWSKRYRVWDANRKIFLYPENWIEPERRLPAPLRAALSEVVGSVCRECGTKTKGLRKAPRGKSVGILFIGTNRARALIAAHALARDLASDLYKIDLSGVVSKYIGETEKNLRRIFDAAEESNALLLFDEADALFGKHSDVKDSHDRYANIEINYLLQRMEEHGALSILTTNKRNNIDASFLRRLRFIISLSPPPKRKSGPGAIRFDPS